MKKVLSGPRARPRRVLLYGTHGIGKSTWAAAARRALFLACEDGLDDVGADRTPLLTDTSEVGQWLIDLSGPEQHGYETVVVDTVDWLEKLILDKTAREAGKKSIEEIGYGKGYLLALKRWEQLLTMLDACRARGMNVVLLAHARIEKFSPPDADAYDRWQPDLHKTVSPMLQEWADEVLFATYRVSTITREEKFGQTRTRAIGSGERVVYTQEAPTHAAKRRINLPDELPLTWSEYQKYWPTGANVAAGGDIAGIVADGHSKRKEQVAA